MQLFKPLLVFLNNTKMFQLKASNFQVKNKQRRLSTNKPIRDLNSASWNLYSPVGIKTPTLNTEEDQCVAATIRCVLRYGTSKDKLQGSNPKSDNLKLCSMAMTANLPIIDLSSSDEQNSANSIRQACMEYGFFYVVNHGVDEEMLDKVFEESGKLFDLPLDEKMKVVRKFHRGYTPLYAENLDPTASSRGDSKESFYVGPLEDDSIQCKLNQWPSQDILPSWKCTIETYYKHVLEAGKKLIPLIALALNLDKDFFSEVGAMIEPNAFLRLLHYPGDLDPSSEEIYGASAHSDYGMITLLATDGVGGLQVCRDKAAHPRVWEDVLSLKGAFIVNIGDIMERWTNCLFRSTLHRVMPTGHERYSLAFFLDPNPDCVVECLKSCYSESSPPKFTPILSKDYLAERLRVTYAHGSTNNDYI